MPDWILTLIPQLGLVILFMWYQERADERRNKRDQEMEIKRENSTQQNHDEWRVFLRERDAEFHAGLGRIAEEVKSNTNVIAAMNAVLIAHDTRAAEAVGDVRRIRERLSRAGIGDLEDSPIPEGKKSNA